MEAAAALDHLLDHLHRIGSPPAGVLDRAEVVLLDSIGAICAGLALPENQALLAAAPVGEEASLLGRSARTTVEWATLLHGTAGTATELDEGHAPARGHPAIHVLPLALALAEAHGRSGHTFLRALVLGYELAARIGMATRLRDGVHPHGTWGTLGAAATASLLLGQDRATFGEAVRIAADLAVAPSFQVALEGATVRNAFAGASGQLGLLAARLAAAGFRGQRRGPAEVFGRILGSHFEAERLVEGLGERWEIERGYFKLHACCRYNHATLDALLALQARAPFGVEEVETIEVATYAAAARLTDPAPRTPLAARFSVPFAVATTLVQGTTGAVAFEPAALDEPRTRALAQRVQVQEEAAFTAMGAARRPARVTVRLRDGRTLVETVFHSKGDPEQPVTDRELEEKYFTLATPVLGEAGVRAVARVLKQLRQSRTIEELAHLLRTGSPPPQVSEKEE